MKITALRIENYRSIEDLSLQFPTFYTAICGKNDSGKTNILRALRVFSGEDDYYYSNIEISISEDFPKWRDKDARNKLICIEVELAVHKVSDEGLYAFLSEYLKLHEEPEYLHFSISLKFVTDSAKPDIGLTLGSASFDALKAEEVLKKLQTTQWLLFHNSPEFPSRYRSRYVEGLLGDLSASDAAQIDLLKKKLEKVAARVAKQNQNEVSELLGRLKDKYRIGLSAPPLDLNELPFSITVGTREAEIPLTSWGSGTQNRTRILMALFKAKRISEAAKSAAKVTPVIIIEEPESFLHPSAQAEFGAILRDLAEELRVQTIVATHSPYMLSLTEPKGNILLERDHSRGSLRATRRLDTSGEGWNLFPLRLVWTMNTSALGKTLFLVVLTACCL